MSFAAVGTRKVLGKVGLPDEIPDLCVLNGLPLLRLAAEHSLAVPTLPLLHRDPYLDRQFRQASGGHRSLRPQGSPVLALRTELPMLATGSRPRHAAFPARATVAAIAHVPAGRYFATAAVRNGTASTT